MHLYVYMFKFNHSTYYLVSDSSRYILGSGKGYKQSYSACLLIKKKLFGLDFPSRLKFKI